MSTCQHNPLQISHNFNLEKPLKEAKQYVLMVHFAAVRVDGAQRAMQKGETTSYKAQSKYVLMAR